MKQMMIKVLNRTNVEKFTTDRPHIVISVRDAGSLEAKLPQNDARIAELYLEFSDMDGAKCPKCMSSIGFRLFSKEDAQSILKVVQLTYPYINTIVVNCEAGISRSAGIAASLSLLLGQGDATYFDPKGPYKPNRFVYRTILDTAIDQDFNKSIRFA